VSMSCSLTFGGCRWYRTL